MESVAEIRKRILTLFDSQFFAVLATGTQDNCPYTNLVAFFADPDLNSMTFITPRATRKFENISKNPSVSLFIDNRNNESRDLADATGVTVTGHAYEATGTERERMLNAYIARHPRMESFARSPGSAVMCVRVERYDVVYRFQNVVTLQVKQE